MVDRASAVTDSTCSRARGVPGGVFIAWRRLSRRTLLLSGELGLETFFVPGSPPYLRAAWTTWRYLVTRKPPVVFVQLPQGPLLAEVVEVSRRAGLKVVADVHTGFIYPTSLKGYALNRPFHTYLRRVDLVLAHNVLQADLVKRRAGVPSERVVLVYDPVPRIPEGTRSPRLDDVDLGRSVVLPASWAVDEPLDYITREFLESEVSRDHVLVITGSWRRNKKLYRKLREVVRKGRAEDRVILTGYLPDEEYYHLIRHCKAIVAVSSREYTLPHVLWEAVAAERLFITLRTETLLAEVGRDYPCSFTMREGSLREVLEYCLDKEYRKAFDLAKVKAGELKLKSKRTLESLVEKLSEILQPRT